MTHIPRTKRLIDGLTIRKVGMIRKQVFAQNLEKLVKTRPGENRYVVRLVDGLWVLDRSRKDICLNDIGDVTEIAARFTVAIYKHRLLVQHRGNPFGDYGGVSAIGILSWTKYVEVAKPHRLQVIALGKNVSVNLGHEFGRRVGRHASADPFLDLWQLRAVAIHRTAGGKHE